MSYTRKLLARRLFCSVKLVILLQVKQIKPHCGPRPLLFIVVAFCRWPNTSSSAACVEVCAREFHSIFLQLPG